MLRHSCGYEEDIRCRKCGKTLIVAPTGLYCPYCGRTAIVICPGCGKVWKDER